MTDKDQPTDEHRSKTDAATREESRLLDRRDYLKLTGATAAAVASVGTMSSEITDVASADSYETIPVPSGQHKKRVVKDGETFQNVLFDVTADGATASIAAKGGGWTIRNVGFKGVHDQEIVERDRGSKNIRISVLGVPSGRSAQIENVYVGDGSIDGRGTGMYVGANHAGTLTIRQCNIQGWADNGIYADAPGKSGNGAVQIEQCYAKNNNIASYRIGTGSSYVRDSVVHVDSYPGTKQGPDTTNGGTNARGIWARRNGGQSARNVDILMEHPDASYGVVTGNGGGITVHDSEVDAQNGEPKYGNVTFDNVGNSPDISVPSGVPQSAIAAANGGSGGGGSHTLEIMGSGDRTSYNFSVDGNLQGSGNLQSGDNIINDGQSAAGAVTGGTDTYTFDGDLRAFDFSGDAINVHLDGEPAHVGQRPDHLLQIEGQGTSTPYSFNVSSNLQGGGNLQNNDNIVNNGWSASGEVGDGTDSYTFDGDLVSFDFDGTVNVLLDGQSAHVGQHPDHLLQIEGTGTSVDYDFTVSGGLQKTTAGGGSINSSDDITNNGQSAAGSVGGGTDSYTFDGDLRAFDFSGGEINVLLDGGPAHVGRLPDDV